MTRALRLIIPIFFVAGSILWILPHTTFNKLRTKSLNQTTPDKEADLNLETAHLEFKQVKTWISAQMDEPGLSKAMRDRRKHNIAAQLSNRGWNLLQKNQPIETSHFFEESLKLNSHGLAHLGFALSMTYQNKRQRARESLEKISTKERTEEIWELLTRLSMDDSSEKSLALATEGLSFFPQSATLKKTLSEINAQRETLLKMDKIDSMPFDVYFPRDLSATKRLDILSMIRETQHDFSSEWPLLSIPRCQVVLSQEPISQPLVAHIPKNRITLPLVNPLQPQEKRLFKKTMAHELTHILLESIAPRTLPPWLHEGLALWTEGYRSTLPKLHELYKRNQLPNYNELNQWMPRPNHSVVAGKDLDTLGMIAHELTDQIVRKHGLNQVLSWIEGLMKSNELVSIDQSFKSKFKISMEQLYQETVTP